MNTMKWLTGILLAGALAVQADDATFWRIRSTNATVITTIDVNGTLAWSNSVPGNNEQVQRATILYPVADWQDYVLVPATGIVTSVQAFDLQPPADMVLIPAGSFVMGHATNVFPVDEGNPDELPQHTVYVSAFYMDKYEVTSNLWRKVYTWAMNDGYIYGYSFGGSWGGKASTHPVRSVDWYDAIAWCNARSQMDGFTPCYTNANGTVYANAAGNSFAGGCNWAANGYRLPTEAEWEKAARGGVANHRFPWCDADDIQHARANYKAATNLFSYDTSPTTGYHPTFATNDTPYTSPVGSFAPNGYGLYDMAGNVWEWCWDWYEGTYYSSSPATDPRGPSSGTDRVRRGGPWSGNCEAVRVADRNYVEPEDESSLNGFRCVRGL